MKHLAVLLAGFAIYSATLEAQAPSQGVPDSHRPPPGMCRIWIDGVPPAHQPAPTDCATAIRKRPMNARVVFGNDAPSANERGFVPGHASPSNFAAPAAPTVQSRDQQDRSAQPQQHDAQAQHDAQTERDAQAQRDAQERQRVEAQRQHEEQQKRDASRRPPDQVQEHVAPRAPPRVEKSQRPPRRSSSRGRPR